MQRGFGVVGMRNGSGVRSIDYGLRLLGGFMCYLAHHFDETVERLGRFRLGGLDHERFVEEQREIDCGRMEAEIEQAFCHVKRGYARRFVDEAVEHKLIACTGRG